MPVYRIHGPITRTLRFDIDEEIEAESEEEALSLLLEDLTDEEAWDVDTEARALEIQVAHEDPEPDQPQRWPLLRERDDREALAAWNAGKPIPGLRPPYV